MRVPVARTVVTSTQFARALILAWREVLGATPTKEACGVIWGQWIVETGGRNCWNWNIGNVKISESQVDAGLDWIDLPGTWEIIGGKKVVLPEGDPGRRFRAFPSLDEAMREHLTFLRNKRYAPSWAFVEAGNADGFARALKRQGYYTAPADDYARILTSAHRSWMQSDAYAAALAELEAEEAGADTLPAAPDTWPTVTRLPELPEPCECCGLVSCEGCGVA